jgi:oligoribonuclease NrnB/cAMP/cGMP phosphodiesterase (DHH superfamily)
MSAAIVRYFNNWQNIDFIPYDYKDTLIPDLYNYEYVIFCDVIFPKESLISLIEKDINILVIDHHISTKQMLESDIRLTKIKYEIDPTHAACYHVWKYFGNGRSIPSIISLLERYDCFSYKGSKDEQFVAEVQYGARLNITDMDSAYSHLQICSNSPKSENNIIKFFAEAGSVILEYLSLQADSYLEQSSIVQFEQSVDNEIVLLKRFKAMNVRGFNPSVFDIKPEDHNVDGFMTYHYTGDLWICTLYSSKEDVDCANIAVRHGGGGHKGAAGFTTYDISLYIR